jgi:hypothetical protein
MPKIAQNASVICTELAKNLKYFKQSELRNLGLEMMAYAEAFRSEAFQTDKVAEYQYDRQCFDCEKMYIKGNAYRCDICKQTYCTKCLIANMSSEPFSVSKVTNNTTKEEALVSNIDAREEYTLQNYCAHFFYRPCRDDIPTSEPKDTKTKRSAATVELDWETFGAEDMEDGSIVWELLKVDTRSEYQSIKRCQFLDRVLMKITDSVNRSFDGTNDQLGRHAIVEIVRNGDIYVFDKEQQPLNKLSHLIISASLNNRDKVTAENSDLRRKAVRVACRSSTLYTDTGTTLFITSHRFIGETQYVLYCLLNYIVIIATLLTNAMVISLQQYQLLIPDATGQDKTAQDAFHYCIIVLPLITSIFLAVLHRFKPADNWIILMSSAEAITREVLKFQTGTCEYSNYNLMHAYLSAETLLANRLKSIDDALIASHALETLIGGEMSYWAKARRALAKVICKRNNQVSDSIETVESLKHEESDDELEDEGIFTLGIKLKGQTERIVVTDEKKSKVNFQIKASLKPDEYVEYRIKERIKYYGDQLPWLFRQMLFWQIMIYVFGAAATIVAAVKFDLWTAMATSFVGAFTSYLELRDIRQKMLRYNVSKTSLNSLHMWWESLTQIERAGSYFAEQLVRTGEEIIFAEYAVYLAHVSTKLNDDKLKKSKKEDQALTIHDENPVEGDEKDEK